MAKDKTSGDQGFGNKDEYQTDAPPPRSNTRDTFSHHSSPHDDEQTPTPTPAATVSGSKRGMARGSGGPQLPDHVTKHPEPVGRPKNRNYD